HLFEKIGSVVMTSATLCAGKSKQCTPMRGTGCQPVFASCDDTRIIKRRGAHLPHWTRPGAIYSVTFRLIDSLPLAVLDSWRVERDAITENARQQNRALTVDESNRLAHLYSAKIEKCLDAAHGECWLKRFDVASLVAEELAHFRGKRYRLLAWCIMPNHVHAV